MAEYGPLRPAANVPECEDWEKVDKDTRLSRLWKLFQEHTPAVTKSEMSLILACWWNESAATLIPLRKRYKPTTTKPPGNPFGRCDPQFVPIVAWDPFVSNRTAFLSSPLATFALKSGLVNKDGKRATGDLNYDPVVFERALADGDTLMLKQFSMGINQYHLGTHLGAPYKPPFDWTPDLQSLRSWWWKACLSVRAAMSIAIPYSYGWAKGFVSGEPDDRTVDRLKNQAGSGYAATYWTIIKPIQSGFFWRMNLK